VLREAFIDERVVRVQHVENISIFTHDTVEQKFRFMLERLAQVIVEVGIDEQVGIPVSQLAQIEPLFGEIAD